MFVIVNGNADYGDDGIVIWKGESREDGNHRSRFNSASGQT